MSGPPEGPVVGTAEPRSPGPSSSEVLSQFGLVLEGDDGAEHRYPLVVDPLPYDRECLALVRRAFGQAQSVLDGGNQQPTGNQGSAKGTPRTRARRAQAGSGEAAQRQAA